MRYALLWVSVHRGVILAAIAALFWTSAVYMYFRGDIARYRHERRARPWSVDMVAKTSKGGRKKAH